MQIIFDFIYLLAGICSVVIAFYAGKFVMKIIGEKVHLAFVLTLFSYIFRVIIYAGSLFLIFPLAKYHSLKAVIVFWAIGFLFAKIIFFIFQLAKSKRDVSGNSYTKKSYSKKFIASPKYERYINGKLYRTFTRLKDYKIKKQ